jgi:hypothetical protein
MASHRDLSPQATSPAGRICKHAKKLEHPEEKSNGQ